MKSYISSPPSIICSAALWSLIALIVAGSFWLLSLAASMYVLGSKLSRSYWLSSHYFRPFKFESSNIKLCSIGTSISFPRYLQYHCIHVSSESGSFPESSPASAPLFPKLEDEEPSSPVRNCWSSKDSSSSFIYSLSMTSSFAWFKFSTIWSMSVLLVCWSIIPYRAALSLSSYCNDEDFVT